MPAPEFDRWMAEQKAGLAERVDTGGDDGGDLPRHDRRVRQAGSRWPQGCLQVPLARRPAAHRPDLARPLPAPRDAGERRDDHRRRGLPDRFDDRSAGQDRAGLQAGHADVQGPAGGAGGRGARGVHQVAAQRRASRTLPSKEATYEPAKPSAVQPAPISPSIPAVNYLNADRGVWSWLLTLDHKRIAHHVLRVACWSTFLLGGIFAMAAPARAADARADHHGREHLQPHVHAARRGHGLPVHDPGDPGRVRQLPAAAHARREGRRVPALNLLSLYLYWTGAIAGDRAAWSRAAPTPAGRSTRPTAPRRRRRCSRCCSASSSSASRRSSPASTSSSPSTRCARPG